ncbi:MAG: hypothetical protein ACYDCL_19540 [Myxococcales bacterium]
MKRTALFTLLAASACSSPLPPLQLPSGCNPLLAGYDCFLPYPTDYFRVADAGSPTGYLVETTGAAKLREPSNGTTPGASADIADFRPLDGYSTLPSVQAVLPAAISPQGFVGLFDDPDAGLAPSSQMLLLEADSAQPVPSFVDLDPRALAADGGGDPEHQAIVLHPYVPLKYQTRYVALLQGVHAADGGLIPAPEGFRRLRDEQSAGDSVLSPLQTHYDQDVFPVIQRAGVSRSALQLAWDFTTGDEGQADGDMIQVRDLTMQWLAQNPSPAVTITSVQENPDTDSWRIVKGTVQGPLFETNAQPGATLSYGSDGKVAQNGLTTFTFTANVPVSVRDQAGPGRTVSYGHGFFGSQDEVTYGSTRAIEQVLHAVFFGVDWWGMSTADAPLLAADILDSPAQTLLFAERVPQAMANWIVMNAAIRGPLLAQSAFQRPATGPGSSSPGQPVYDGVTNYYLGISQGAILGGVLAALSPDFRQIVLNVGGGGFTQMMWRAEPFQSFLYFIDMAFPDPLEQQKLTGSLQVLFDRIDPLTYAPHVLQNPLPQSPPRRVLMQNGLGDLEVPNLGSFLEARALGLPEVAPNTFPVYLLPQETAPLQGSAMTLWDFGIDLQAAYGQAQPAATNDNPVHEGVRLQPSVLAQMDAFFQDGGAVIDPCGGPCYATDAGLNENLPDAGPDAGPLDAGLSDAGSVDGGAGDAG